MVLPSSPQLAAVWFPSGEAVARTDAQRAAMHRAAAALRWQHTPPDLNHLRLPHGLPAVGPLIADLELGDVRAVGVGASYPRDGAADTTTWQLLAADFEAHPGSIWRLVVAASQQAGKWTPMYLVLPMTDLCRYPDGVGVQQPTRHRL